MLNKGYQPMQPMPMVFKQPESSKKYTNKAIKKGLGIPTAKPMDFTITEFAAKCMLDGYKAGKKKAEKKYKKQIKKLKAQLKEADKKPQVLGTLEKIEEGDITGLSFKFEPEK